MKTKKFIEKVRDLGYSIQLENHTQYKWADITVDDDDLTERDKQVARIATAWEAWGTLNDMEFSGHNEIELLNVITEYLVTPLEKREEEKKYHVKVNNPILKELADELDSFFLNRGISASYFLADEDQENGYQTQFTQKEIDNFPDEVKAVLPLCEKIEVTES